MNAILTKTTLLLLATMLFASANAQKAKKWTVDKSHASVRFEIDHFFSSVHGQFTEFDGEIYFSPNDLKNSKVSFTITVSSIDTDEPKRDEHLQSEDFFHQAKYPTIVFTSTSFEKGEDDQYIVHGTLTMRGTTRKVSLPLEITGRMDNPWAEGKEILGVSIETELNRTDYGVGTGSWAATTTVGDEVSIEIDMELDGKK